MEEREIDLIDLIADILAHWRSVLVAVIVGAVLLGAYSYGKSYQEVQNAQNEQVKASADNKTTREEEIKQMKENLSDDLLAGVDSVIASENKYDLKEIYYKNSLYMQLDPLNVVQKELVYQIQSEENSGGSRFGNIYENVINNVGLYDWIEQQTGMDAGYVSELISADVNSGMTIADGTQILWSDSNCIKIIIIQKDEESCEKLTGAVKEYLTMQQEDLSQKIGNHEMVLLSETMGTVTNTGVLNSQTAYRDEISSLKATIAATKAGFTEEQKQYYDLLTQNDSAIIDTTQDTVTEPVTVQKPSISIKYVVLGAVIFAFVYAMILCLMYIFNGKLRASDELQNLYQIPQMGLIVKDSKKKLLPDKWVDNLRNHGKRKFTPAQSMELAVAAVKIAAVKNGLDHVCLMGCNLAEGADNVCESIKQALEKEQIAVTILDNVLYNAEAMEKLENEKGVVLVEKAGSTLYNEVAKEIELLTRQDIAVLGDIVVE